MTQCTVTFLKQHQQQQQQLKYVLIMLSQLLKNVLHVLIYILISTHFQIQVETERMQRGNKWLHLWKEMEQNVNIANWSIISFVCSIVSAGITVAAGQTFIFSPPFPRRLWETAEQAEAGEEWAHDWSSLSVLLARFSPLRIVSITLTGSYTGSSEWLNSFFFLFSHSKIFCLAVNQQILSIPSPSLRARLAPHRYDCPSAHRQGLSTRLCGSSHGSFLLQPAN